MVAYYNEFKPEAAHMLRHLIKDGLIAPGDVDERSITEVKPDDLKGYTQCHFFAGIGGWSVALRQAGWSDDRPVWTGSCPCQPFSTAGKQKGTKDERHLWPVWFNLIRECRPSTVFGEQVASAIAHGWLDGVYADMEAQGYAIGSAVLPACAVDAPHKRDRLWFVANAKSERSGGAAGTGRETPERPQGFNSVQLGGTIDVSTMGNAEHHGSLSAKKFRCHETPSKKWGQERQNFSWESARTSESRNVPSVQRSDIGEWWDSSPNGIMAYGDSPRLQGQRGLIGEYDTQGRQEQAGHNTASGFWNDADWIVCADGKARRIPTTQSGICIVAHGLQHRAPLLHAFGNAIVPEVASRFIQACM